MDWEYKDHDWFTNAEVMNGFREVVRRILGEEYVMAAVNELAKYKAFNDPLVLEEAKNQAGFLVWMLHGAAVGCKLLQKLGMLILPLTSTASSCERNWSAYGFVYNRLRNKLSVKRAEDLVYVYHNMRLIAKRDKRKGVVEFVTWDPEEAELADDEQEDGLEDDLGKGIGGKDDDDHDSEEEWV